MIATVIVVPPLDRAHSRARSPTTCTATCRPSAGQLAAQTSQQSGDVLSGWQGFGVFCAWTAVLVVACGWLLVTRDA